MIMKSFQAGRALEPIAIFWRFVRDTLLTAIAYVLLVSVTVVLIYFTDLLKKEEFHYKIVEGLELLIFVAGSLLVALVLIVLTAIGVIDLLASLRAAFIPAAGQHNESVGSAPRVSEIPTEAATVVSLAEP